MIKTPVGGEDGIEVRMQALALADVESDPPRAFAAFFREHYGFAWRTLRRLGVPASECDDAAQEVFVTIHRRWSTGGADRRAWLFGIARRIASRARRARERHDRRLAALGEQAPMHAIDLDAELGRRRAWEQLAQFLDQLDDDKREAFVLGELEELGRVELGAVLGINPNTAYSRLQAARRRFFAYFAQQDDDACAELLAHAVLETTPDERARERGLSAIVPLLGPAPFLQLSAALVGKLAVAIAITVTVIALATTPARTSSPSPAAVAVPAAPVPIAAAIVPTTIPAAVQEAAVVATAQVPTASPRKRSIVPRGVAPIAALPPARVAADRDDASLAAELELLLAARQAMLAGDAATARRQLDAHREQYGTSTTLAELRARIDRELSTSVITKRESGD